MTAFLLWTGVCCCGQVGPDPGYMREAVANARYLESTFLEPTPPSTITVKDQDWLRKLAKTINFVNRGWRTTPGPQQGHLFKVRVFPADPKAAPVEFTLMNKYVVSYGPDDLYDGVLGTREFHDLLFLEHRKETEQENLSFVEAYTVPAGERMGSGNSLAITRDGRFLHIADAGHHALHRFIRYEYEGNGSLRPRYQQADVEPSIDDAHPHTHLRTPQSLAISADDRFLYLVATASNAVTVFCCTPDRGPAKVVQVVKSNRDGAPGMEQPASIALSPDGRHAYVAASASRCVLAFARNPQDGTLTYIESQSTQDFPAKVALSPDGRHVYVIANCGGLLAYRRNETDGRLEPVEVLRDVLESGCFKPANRALLFGSSLIVSADGANVYTTSLRFGVAAWTRDRETGKLTFLQRLGRDAGVVKGLEYALAVALHPNGKRLYVAAAQDNALTVFDRRESDGMLRFLETLTNGQGGIRGLRGAQAVTVSPDGKNIYVGSAESPVVAFAVAGYSTAYEVQRGWIERR